MTCDGNNDEVPWGGKRSGSGRKAPPSGKRQLISGRVLPETAEKLRKEAKRRGVSIGRVIDEWGGRSSSINESA